MGQPHSREQHLCFHPFPKALHGTNPQRFGTPMGTAVRMPTGLLVAPIGHHMRSQKYLVEIPQRLEILGHLLGQKPEWPLTSGQVAKNS